MLRGDAALRGAVKIKNLHDAARGVRLFPGVVT